MQFGRLLVFRVWLFCLHGEGDTDSEEPDFVPGYYMISLKQGEHRSEFASMFMSLDDIFTNYKNKNHEQRNI